MPSGGEQQSNTSSIELGNYAILHVSLLPIPTMGLLPDTQHCGVRMRRECRERFPRLRGLAIPTRITARALRTCRDACWDR